MKSLTIFCRGEGEKEIYIIYERLLAEILGHPMSNIVSRSVI